jgi:hypothetical protein
MSPLRSGTLWFALVLSACSAEEVKDKAEEVKDKAKEVGDAAKQKAGELADDAVDKGKQAVDKGKDALAQRRGELSDGAKGLLARGAAASGDGVESMLTRGVQLAPVALEVGKSLHGAIDSDTDIEPIVQDLEDADAQAELDKRIQDMPRVETIDGVSVGFKDMTQWDSGGRESESAYLILWRADKRLFGLVYRSKKRVNIDKLVAEAPRLIKLAQGAA